MGIDDLLRIGEHGIYGILAVALFFFWKEVKGIKAAIHNGNEAVQEILVKALTGELKSYAQWKTERGRA